ncbi:MAG: murein transglycosylase domain-containing protein [Campylobacteraceae bacterium]|jgi:membrane-bound lytic murein transglycosylase C|nr:murein transglycosylase domain-containing protein [Campylobacteraceae bacterium]
MKKTILILISLLFLGCTTREYQKVIVAAASQNPKAALEQIAKSRAIDYSLNPSLIKSDIKKLENIADSFSSLRKAVVNVWGEKDAKEPAPKEYVKYLNNYKSRALIDYENGIVRIESVDTKTPKESLKSAIKTALLMPHDPRGEELFNSDEIKLEGEPYLYNEVLDNEGEPIRWEWRADKFADYLIKNELKTQKTIYYVQIAMVKKHGDIRAQKYQDIVNIYATKYAIEPKLIYAIIKTESDFNQYAVSRSGAVGLMQIMPKTAGADAYQELYKKSGQPSAEYLFDPKNNIEMGSVYVDILKSRYLKDINDKLSKEYCVISSYNGGSGTVLKTFNAERTKAFSEINRLSSAQVYTTLTTKVSSEETRNYLVKVTNNKKLY